VKLFGLLFCLKVDVALDPL